MITASEILDAVKKGGMSKWRPASELRTKEKSPNRINHKQQVVTETKALKVLHAMGNKVWTVNELYPEVGLPPDTCRDYLHRLVKQGKVKKSVASQPHKFWKLNAK